MQRVYRRRRIVAGLVLLAILASVWWVASAALGAVRSVPVDVKGLRDGQMGLNAARAPEIRVPGSATRVKVDGVDVFETATRDGSRLLIRPPSLGEGKHRVSVTVSHALRPGRTATVDFRVDGVPPEVTVKPVGAVEHTKPVVVEGTVEAGATVRVGATPVAVHDRKYRIELPAPAPAEVVVTAIDPAGNEGTARVAVPSIQPPTRAVHMSATAWVTPFLRDPILKMLDEHRVNAIQLDVKDEAGEVGHGTQVPLAKEIGAAKNLFVLKDAADEIHRRGGRVIARIVTLRDPKLAQASWDAGRKEDLVQTPDGQRFGAYGGGFLNTASARVRDYTVALAVEAAQAGVDDVLLDYIRRPDGRVEGMLFAGLAAGDKEKALEDAIVRQVTDLQDRVRAAGARLGASVYGISASRPQEIAQDIPRMSQHLDFVSPMLYPSHWAKGEYNVADPNRMPGPITTKAVADFQKATAGSPAAVVPWFQDFSLGGVTYGETEVRAQLDAAAQLGVKDFLLWDAACTFTTAALDPQKA